MLTGALLLAAEDPAAASGGGLVAVLVAVAGALGVIVTALAPALTERVKRGKVTPSAPPEVPASSPGAPAGAQPPAPATVTPTPERLTGDVFDLIEDQITDLRRQRDAAQNDNYELRRQLSMMQQRLWQYEGSGQHRRYGSP